MIKVSGDLSAFGIALSQNRSGWIALAVGAYLSGTLGLFRSITLGLMSALLIGVLIGTVPVSSMSPGLI